MIRATFVLPSLLGRSARPMFWTISTWEPRVSAKPDGFDSPFAGDVDAFSEDAAAGEEGAVDPAPGGVVPLANWRKDLAPLGEVVAAQPCRPRGPGVRGGLPPSS